MAFEVDFLSVGQSNGDAIAIRYRDGFERYKIHVTDGGYQDTGRNLVDHILKYYDNPTYIDNVVLSHQDRDHASGLLEVIEYFEIGALWMNRPWQFAADIAHRYHGNYTTAGLERAIRDAYPILVELENAAYAKSIPIYDAFAGSKAGNFTILSPSRKRYIELIPDFDGFPGRTPADNSKKSIAMFLVEAARALKRYFETWVTEALEENPSATSASNESCVVQLGEFDGQAVLLTADAGPRALADAANVAEFFGKLRPPALVQVPHHGSRRNVTPSVLNRWLGYPLPEGSARVGVAFCSVGENKPEYPRKRVSNAFLRRGYPVYKSSEPWIHYGEGMPNRAGLTSVDYVPFTANYEE